MIKFRLTRSKKTKAPIGCYINYFGWRGFKSLSISVSPNKWDKKMGRMKPSDLQANSINQLLNDVRDKAEKIYMDAKIFRKSYTVEEFINELFKDDRVVNKDELLSIGFTKFIERKSEIMTADSIKIYNSVRSLLDKWNPKITVFTNKNLEEFVHFMKVSKYNPNYINKAIGIIRNYHKSIDRPIDSISVKSAIPDKTYLTIDELDIIYAADLPISLVEHRDLFIFSCWTALRYSDLQKLNKDNFKMINEVMCLVQFDKKTGSKSVIPLFPHALEIATKYEFNLPKRISSQNFNEYIKEICRISGVDSVITLTKLEAERRIPYQIEKWKVVSTHTARRSFITNMSSYGLTDKQISLMSGHKNLKTVGLYDKTQHEINAVSVFSRLKLQ